MKVNSADVETLISALEWGQEAGADPEQHEINVRSAMRGLRYVTDELDVLASAARQVVLAYQEANPMRTADMHPAECGCLRCEIDRLDHVSDRYR